MISRETIEAIVAEKLEEENLFIVDISISPKNTITIMLDGEKGVSIKSCVAISRLVESKLDRNVEDYGLEVTSAGLGQPFRVVRQYSINIGREVEVLLLDGNKFKALLWRLVAIILASSIARKFLWMMVSTNRWCSSESRFPTMW